MNTRQENKATVWSSLPSFSDVDVDVDVTRFFVIGVSFEERSERSERSSVSTRCAGFFFSASAASPGGSRKMYHRNAENATIPKMGSA